MDFAVQADNRVKFKENEPKVKYFGVARKLKKTDEHKSDGDTNRNYCSWYSHQMIIKGTGILGNKRTLETIQTTALLIFYK